VKELLRKKQIIEERGHIIFIYFFPPDVLGARALCIISTYSTTELCPQSHFSAVIDGFNYDYFLEHPTLQEPKNT
jgi:hypothetical protein